MGLIDRIRTYAERFPCTGGEDGANTDDTSSRSPRERELIQHLQGLLVQNAKQVVRYRLLFSGTVQGVGFRWTNQGTANELHLTGWVKNLDDGSVAMELQGTCSGVIKHLDAIHAHYRRMGCRVWLEHADELQVNTSELGFSVRY